MCWLLIIVDVVESKWPFCVEVVELVNHFYEAAVLQGNADIPE